MTGPSLAPLIIPIAGTLFLTTWLILVFYAGRRPRRAGAPPTDPGGPANTCHSRARRRARLGVIIEVER